MSNATAQQSWITDADDPSTVVARTPEPILPPETGRPRDDRVRNSSLVCRSPAERVPSETLNSVERASQAGLSLRAALSRA